MRWTGENGVETIIMREDGGFFLLSWDKKKCLVVGGCCYPMMTTTPLRSTIHYTYRYNMKNSSHISTCIHKVDQYRYNMICSNEGRLRVLEIQLPICGLCLSKV